MKRRLAFVLVTAVCGLATAAGASGAANGVVVHEFRIGPVILPQPQLPGRFREMPIPLDGVIALPASTKPAPLVVILHGTHPGCRAALVNDVTPWPCPHAETIRNYDGFRYLQRALAHAGIASVAIDLNGAYTEGWGEPNDALRTGQITDLFLSYLAEANRTGKPDFGIPLQGRLDLARMALLGHSRAGGNALKLAVAHQEHPGPVAEGKGPFASVLALQPARSFDAVLEPNRALPSEPVSVVVSGCDGDLGTEGAWYYDVGRANLGRNDLTALVFLQGANHNAFNTVQAGRDDGATMVAYPGCAPAERLPVKRQQEFLALYATDFFRTTLLGARPSARSGLDPAVPPAGEVEGFPALTALALPISQRVVLQFPRTTGGVTRTFWNEPVQTNGVDVQWCPPPPSPFLIQFFCRPGLQQLSNPPQLRLRWNGTGASYVAPVPNQAHDLRGFAHVALRLAVDPTDPLNAKGRPQQLTVVLRDGHGGVAKVALPAGTPALRYPPGLFYGDTPAGYAAQSAIRVPLSSFHGVDLGDVTSVGLRFDRPSGVVLLTDLELLKR